MSTIYAEPQIKIERAWAMPSRHTLTIKPILDFTMKHMDEPLPGWWVDPFAGFHSVAGTTNDLNPNAPTNHHMDARDFLKGFDVIFGILLDPPYSPRQISECYKSIGKEVTDKDTRHAQLIAECKDIAAERMRPGAKAITCGWNSNGFGKSRGFRLTDILVCAHGASHNDTIVTVEVKE
jgi:hypothetical protein